MCMATTCVFTDPIGDIVCSSQLSYRITRPIGLVQMCNSRKVAQSLNTVALLLDEVHCASGLVKLTVEMASSSLILWSEQFI